MTVLVMTTPIQNELGGRRFEVGSCVEGCKNIWSSTVGEQTMLKSYINTGGGAYAVAMICRNMLNLLLGQESQVGVQVLLSSDSTMTSSVCTQVFTCVHCIYCTQVGTALHHLFYFTLSHKQINYVITHKVGGTTTCSSWGSVFTVMVATALWLPGNTLWVLVSVGNG